MSKRKRRKARNYKREYARYHGTPKQKKRRAARNRARRIMTRRVGKSKLRGKDVHHKNSRSLSSKGSNLAVISKSKNRGFRRNRNNKNLGLRKSRRK